MARPSGLARTVGHTILAWARAGSYAAALARGARLRDPAGRRMIVLMRNLPPHFHGGSFRQVALLQLLERTGWELDVITNAAPATPEDAGVELLSRMPAGIRLHRWEVPEERGSWRLTPRLGGGFSAVSAILRVAPADGGEVAVVFASGPPFAELVAAAIVARRRQARCVLGYRDEWTTSDFAFVGRSPGDRWWERLCHRQAVAVVFATEGMRRHYLETFPALRAKLTVAIRNGWDDTGAFTPAAIVPPSGESPATIGFFGALGEHWDFPDFAEALAAALRREPELADRIGFHLYGRLSPENSALVRAASPPGVLVAKGLVPHAEAQRLMTTCNALVLFNSRRLHRAIPGKLYEYIASRRPILLYGDGGEMGALLREVPGTSIVQSGDEAGLRAALHRILDGTAAAELAAADPSYVEAHRRSSRDREWIRFFESVRTLQR